MAGYAVLDLFIGLLPVGGDIVDFALRANNRNWALLEGYLDELEGRPPRPGWQRWLVLGALVAGLLAALWLAWVVGSALVGALFGA